MYVWAQRICTWRLGGEWTGVGILYGSAETQPPQRRAVVTMACLHLGSRQAGGGGGA